MLASHSSFLQLSRHLYSTLNAPMQEIVRLLAVAHDGLMVEDIAAILNINLAETRTICFQQRFLLQPLKAPGGTRFKLFHSDFKKHILELIDEWQKKQLNEAVGEYYLDKIHTAGTVLSYGTILKIREQLMEADSSAFVAAVLQTLSPAVLLESIEGKLNIVSAALERSKDLSERALLLYALALERIQRKELNQSIELCRRSLSTLRTTNAIPFVETLVLSTLAYLLHRAERFQEALLCEQQALSILRDFLTETGFSTTVAAHLCNIALLHQKLGNLREALSFYNEALNEDMRTNNMLAAAADWRRIGGVLQDIGDYNQAFRAHTAALEFDRNLANKLGVAWDCGNLGVVCLNMGDKQGARQWLKDALEVFQHLGRDLDMAKTRQLLDSIETGGVELAVKNVSRTN